MYILELQFSLIAKMLGWALYLTILITGSLMEADIGSCSLYCEIFRFLMIVENKLLKTLAVFLSFFKTLVPSTSVIFSLDIILLDSNGLTAFQKFYIITYIFYSQIFTIFSFTFSQKCNAQVLLFVIIDFIFLTPIFEKNIPESCSYHNCFR